MVDTLSNGIVVLIYQEQWNPEFYLNFLSGKIVPI